MKIAEHFYDRDIETLSRADLVRLQDSRIRANIERIQANQFYLEKARNAGFELTQIQTVDDLRRLPFTTKQELVDEQAAHPPFGRLLTYPLHQYCHYHQTSGTTGRPLKWMDTAESWEWWNRTWGYVYRAAGVTSYDVIFCAFSFGPFISHWGAISGGWHVGAACISGGGMNTEQRLRSIIENRATVLVCTPTYALHLVEAARLLDLDLRASTIRIGIQAGEPGASLPNVKRRIEEGLGLTCFDHAGATEAGPWGFDCVAQTGAMHLNEAEFVFEAIDPATGEPVEDGARGELVVTNLGRYCMPVLRYRTGDLVELFRETCPCGRSFARIKGGVVGRSDDMIVVRGVNLYPSAIDNLLRSISGILEYEVTIRRVSGLDELSISIECVGEDEFARTSREVIHAFRTEYSMRVTVNSAPTASLPRYEFKARRFKRIE